MTPTYQSAHTLPRALRSLLHQTYENWEWILVNDGSTDTTSTFLSQQTDHRIRSLTLKENCGRGFVRELALREASGEYVCALDADDWFYCQKLEQQVAAFQEDPSLTAVTVGMAVTDRFGELIGVEGRVSRRTKRLIPGPLSLRFPFGPTMIRTQAAQEAGFHTGLRRGADLDFFLRLLCGNGRYLCHLPVLGYTYQGHTESTIGELLSGHAWSRKVYLRHLRAFPRDGLILILSSLFKSVAYRSSRFLGVSDWLSRRRFSPYSDRDLQEYNAQRARIGV